MHRILQVKDKWLQPTKCVARSFWHMYIPASLENDFIQDLV